MIYYLLMEGSLFSDGVKSCRLPPQQGKIGSIYCTYLTNYFITVAVSQDFLNYLFHESNPSGPLINRLKWFYFKVYFHGNIRKICDSVEANTARTPPHANTA